VKGSATCTPALRHTAAQHCGAFDVRSAQTGQEVFLCDELQGAALHAARVGSVVCYVPLLKHRHVGVAAPRHAKCQRTGELERSACYTALGIGRSTAKAGVVDYSGYSTLLGRLRPQCPANLEIV